MKILMKKMGWRRINSWEGKMNITETKQGNVTVIKPQGRLDSISAPEFESRMGALIDGGNRLIAVDCTELPYVSSAGLRVLLIGAKKASACQGSISLASVETSVKNVLAVTGFLNLFRLFKSAPGAVAELASAS